MSHLGALELFACAISKGKREWKGKLVHDERIER